MSSLIHPPSPPDPILSVGNRLVKSTPPPLDPPPPLPLHVSPAGDKWTRCGRRPDCYRTISHRPPAVDGERRRRRRRRRRRGQWRRRRRGEGVDSSNIAVATVLRGQKGRHRWQEYSGCSAPEVVERRRGFNVGAGERRLWAEAVRRRRNRQYRRKYCRQRCWVSAALSVAGRGWGAVPSRRVGSVASAVRGGGSGGVVVSLVGQSDGGRLGVGADTDSHPAAATAARWQTSGHGDRRPEITAAHRWDAMGQWSRLYCRQSGVNLL